MPNRGHTTQDILALNQQHPAEHSQAPEDREIRLRRFGRRALIVGITLPVLVFVCCLTAALLAEHGVYNNQDAKMFTVLGAFALSGLGFLLAALGGAERLHRPIRAQNRQLLLAAEQNAGRLTGLAVDTNDRFHVVMGLIGPLPGRLDAIGDRLTGIEKTVRDLPDYGQGVIDGAQMRATVLGEDKD